MAVGLSEKPRNEKRLLSLIEARKADHRNQDRLRQPGGNRIRILVPDALMAIDDINYFDTLDAIPLLPALLKGAIGQRKFHRR